MTFRYVPHGLQSTQPAAENYLNTLDRAVLTEIQTGGELFLSNAFVDGRFLLRACIVNFRTLQQDIDAIPSILAAAGQRLDEKMRPTRLLEDSTAIAPVKESVGT